MNKHSVCSFGVYLLFCISTASGQIFVRSGANGDGSSWRNALGDLSVALTQARYGSQIWVAKGTYFPITCAGCTEQERLRSFIVPAGVKLIGGFAGTETGVSQRDLAANPTILSGDIDRDGTFRQNSYTVVRTIVVDTNTQVDGFTITLGNADGVAASLEDLKSSGGGWYNGIQSGSDASPLIRNCRFVRNQARGFGGAMYNEGSESGKCKPRFFNCVFESNTSGYDGGALYNTGAEGGACEPYFMNCKFMSNRAGTVEGSGGAMLNNGINGSCRPVLLNCELSQNVATLDGGAVYNHGKGGKSNPLLVNCTLYNNQAGAGGAIYNLGSEDGESNPDIINCTFYANEASAGGAMYNLGGTDGVTEPRVINSIFSKNTAKDGPAFFNIEAAPKVSFCLVDLPDCPYLNAVGPQFTPPPCGEGIIFGFQPQFVDPENNNFRLQYNSPAIDRGNNEVLEELASRLGGGFRIVLDRVDIGAFEYDGPPPTRVNTFWLTPATPDGVNVHWFTMREYLNQGFQIERSTDNDRFFPIAWIPGKTDTVGRRDYLWLDAAARRGLTYFYRIRRFNLDQSFEFSEVAQIYLPVEKGNIEIFPNPAHERIKVALYVPEAQEVLLEVYAPSGQLVLRQTQDLPVGRQEISLHLPTATAGIYYVSVIFLDARVVLPVVIKP